MKGKYRSIRERKTSRHASASTADGSQGGGQVLDKLRMPSEHDDGVGGESAVEVGTALSSVSVVVVHLETVFEDDIGVGIRSSASKLCCCSWPLPAIPSSSITFLRAADESGDLATDCKSDTRILSLPSS
jgi:hypothetical protein